jgi:eukaryotic-like serine/threonine-protein kinase
VDCHTVYLCAIDTPATAPRSPLFRAESEAAYVPGPDGRAGYVLSVADGRIEVRRFDSVRLTVSNDARTIGLTSAGNSPCYPMMLSATADVLAFASSSVPYGNKLESIGRSSDGERVVSDTEAQNWPRLSPDGRRLAWQRIDSVHGNPNIWVEDLDRGARVRVTTAPEPDMLPVWSPDGSRVAFVSGPPLGRPGTRTLAIANADGSGGARTFPCPGECYPTDWTSDGRDLIVNVLDAKGQHVWAIEASGSSAARPLLDAAFTQRDARISPDRRWIAYVSEESGRPEVSVRNLSGPPTRIVISPTGGDQPVWGRNGTELFFVNPQGRLQSVAVHRNGDATGAFGLPSELNVPPIGFGHWGTQYDVSPTAAASTSSAAIRTTRRERSTS